MNITVLGAGAWGTALAVQAAVRHRVCLWARDGAQAAAMRTSARNARYLGDVALPSELILGSDLAAALAHARDGLLVVATPMAGLAGLLEAIRAGADPATPLVWLCKGFTQDGGELGHEVAARLLPDRLAGVLSGPSFAIEVARGQPTALVAASASHVVRERAVQAFHAERLRVYTSDDPVGVEVGGAVKNVLAIATGIADGLPGPGTDPGLGLNARAALITRGLAEMTRLGVALGARAETFMGLSGLGDLVLTATGALSRNRQVGLSLAQGRPLAAILAELGHVAEGVLCAPTVLRRAEAYGVDMPITRAVVDVIEGRLGAAEAVGALMARDARRE